MTENKRFVHKYDGMFHHLLDMNKKNFDTQKIQSIDECVDLLNELHEENKRLERKIGDLETENYAVMKRVNELIKND